MKKIIKFILSLILITAIIAFGTSCSAYNEAINIGDMESVVEEIQSNDSYIKIEDISKDFLDAIVAIEDKRFYKHGAIDLKGLIRAVVRNIQAGELVQGGSTITQQVVKNIYFDNDQSMERKVAEMRLAFEMEMNYDKDEILELYVNIIYFGDNNYGIKAASNNYFNKAPSELTYDESTLLAGLPQAPSAYALSENMDLAVQRQQYVIEALEEFRGN